MSDEQDHDIRDSTPNSTGPDRAAGGMGVSSERTGPTGPGQDATDGIRDVTSTDDEPEGDIPPEQRPGAVEENPEGLPPKSGYSSVDPRSEDS